MDDLKVMDPGKKSNNRRLLDLERDYSYLESKVSRIEEEFKKLTIYVNEVIDSINKRSK